MDQDFDYLEHQVYSSRVFSSIPSMKLADSEISWKELLSRMPNKRPFLCQSHQFCAIKKTKTKLSHSEVHRVESTLFQLATESTKLNVLF